MIRTTCPLTARTAFRRAAHVRRSRARTRRPPRAPGTARTSGDRQDGGGRTRRCLTADLNAPSRDRSTPRAPQLPLRRAPVAANRVRPRRRRSRRPSGLARRQEAPGGPGLVAMLPAHKTYVEPFAGQRGGALRQGARRGRGHQRRRPRDRRRLPAHQQLTPEGWRLKKLPSGRRREDVRGSSTSSPRTTSSGCTASCT